ncbi:MAG: hypothetical protein FK734_00860 [Asgard group archaeon]|nr:hypothetical protein [Asgard group archaeon]
MAQEYFYLVTTIITALFAVIFSFIMNFTFFRKRTLGSAFMMIAFGMISAGEIFNSLALWLINYDAASDITIGILQAFYTNFVALSILYFYYFSTRNILRDNDVIKSIIIVLMTEMVATVTATEFAELMLQSDLYFNTTEIISIGNSNLTLLAPTIYLLLILFLPLLTLILLRMIITLIRIQRKITDPVANRGILYITISIIALTINTTAIMLSNVEQISSNVGLIMFLQIVRVISTMIVMVFGYLGWILPDWLKKRIRGKAWIVQEYKKMMSKPITVAYSSSANTIRKETVTQIKEISDT